MKFELDNVELNFSGKNLLKGIYLKAEIGNVTGLLGSNGCGKSCLLQIFFGSMKAKYRLVRINHKPIIKPLYKTKKVKFLPQFNFIPNNVTLKTIFKLHEVEWSSFINTFKAFTLYANNRFRDLSGGERRLLETYLVLKSNCPLILLDEPFSHLSPLNINILKELIVQEKTNKAIVVTDHLYKHIIDVSDEIYLLKNGSTKKINDLKELEAYRYLSEGSLKQPTST